MLFGCRFLSLSPPAPRLHSLPPRPSPASAPLPCRALGSPTEATYPGLSLLPHWNPAFPRFKRRGLPRIEAALGPEGCDLLYRLLCYDPEARLTAAQALQHPFLATGQRAPPRLLPAPVGTEEEGEALSTPAAPGDNSSLPAGKQYVLWMVPSPAPAAAPCLEGAGAATASPPASSSAAYLTALAAALAADVGEYD